MFDEAKEVFASVLQEIRQTGVYKEERVITTPQSARIVTSGAEVLNFCSNNYLGLSSHPAVLQAAHAALDARGHGLSSVRFICGTLDLHKTLEATIARFFGTDDAILYGSCFDANGGLFEALLGEQDAIISDALNHASIIDGIRLCKARRLRYAHDNLEELEQHLRAAQGNRLRLIATDGVFSMDGNLARLGSICDLADRYRAMVMVDDSHATGFIGARGRGTPEHCGVMQRVDVITSTLGKALGGANGGFATGRREIIDVLRQRSRPYVFSNALAPAIVASAIAVFDMLDRTSEPRDRVLSNARQFRDGMTRAGFAIQPGFHPIVPVVLGDARLAMHTATALLDEGIYVIGFAYPVVPHGQARIRVQLSAAHTPAEVDRCIEAFVTVGRRMGIVPGHLS